MTMLHARDVTFSKNRMVLLRVVTVTVLVSILPDSFLSVFKCTNTHIYTYIQMPNFF